MKLILNNLINTAAIILLCAFFASCGGRSDNKEGGQHASETVKAGMVIALSDSIIDNRKADTIDFGRVREGEILKRDFRLCNKGDKALVITSVDFSCGCLSSEYPKYPLKPDEDAPMSISLDTRGFGGWVYKTVIVQTSLCTRPYVFVVTAEIE